MERHSRIADFETFWPFYVSQHLRPGTRALHFAGTTLALVLIGTAVATARPVLYGWAMFSGYFFAWIGHFFIEKNRPATFQYPLWSLAADFKMYALMWRGRMEAEVEKLTAFSRAPAS
ncbi:MAG TPA: DUF962 domain-containing protein [Thermoanaerobaculia bacterium]|nr:DUF962 domain-containing protein [Thermoanaerobaculia bacterium]